MTGSGNNTLIINAGSSSVKFRLYEENHNIVVRGEIDALGKNAVIKIDSGEKSQKIQELRQPVLTHESGGKIILEIIKTFSYLSELKTIVHRVVHGGATFTRPTRITPSVLHDLKKLIPLAPLHQPASLTLIEFFARTTNARQIACFDTMFHATLPACARQYALPQKLVKKHDIIRYGFHGLSHATLLAEIQTITKKKYRKVITGQLGNGVSLCAIKDGKSSDTSMGFTPLEGLPMGTRSGTIDPSIIPFLCTVEKKTPQQILSLLEHESGFKALAGASDVRIVRKKAANGNTNAQFALDFFAYHVRKQIGAYVAALNGIDGIVLGGGIVRAPEMRRRLLGGLETFGVQIDSAQCEKDAPVKVSKGPVDVWILETDEQEYMYEITRKLL